MKRDWWDQEFQWLFTMGESITAGGWSGTRERSWPSQLARQINDFQRVPVQLVNVGIGANVISTKSPAYEFSGKPAASERLDKHVLHNNANGGHIAPDMLILSYGINDARGGTPIGLFIDVMRSLIERVRAEIQPLIVLVGPYYMTDFELGGETWAHGSLEIFHQYNDAIRALAEETDCLFADLLETYGEADWLVHGDGVHANDLGHRLVANKIFEVLASNCSGLANETKLLEKQIAPWRDEATLQRD